MIPARFRAALASLLLPLVVHAGGDDGPSGAVLHESHCTRCHDDAVYTRDKRLVNTLEELRNRVRQCELMAEAGWFDEEVEAVVSYLNEQYYRFGE